MPPDQPRSQAARTAAEAALVRVVQAYGQRPEFVLIGGLVPELLCATTTFGINDLGANFADPTAQGPDAYASQMTLDHPEVPDVQARADAVVAVQSFIARLLP